VAYGAGRYRGGLVCGAWHRQAHQEGAVIKAYFDGACEPINPGGHCGYGAVVFGDDGKVVWETAGYIPPGETSNNVAEYTAFLQVLSYLKEAELCRREIVIRGDSMLVIRQMFGHWRMKSGYYVAIARKAKAMLSDFRFVRGEWIPRDQNGHADELSKLELKRRGVQFAIQR
jgi:ribonuclease HI